MKASIGEGIFLRPTPEQAALIWAAVREEKLPENGEGVLQLLLLYLTGDAERPENSLLVRMLRENPDVIKHGAAALGNLASRFFKQPPK